MHQLNGYQEKANHLAGPPEGTLVTDRTSILRHKSKGGSVFP